MYPHKTLKLLLWLYFWLLLLEGALRKWIFPGYSNILFVVRDPVVLLIYLQAWRTGVFPWRPAVVFIWLIATVSLITGLAAESSFTVTLFGLRTDFLHLPLVFVMERVCDREDVVTFGKWILLTSIPIVLLMLLQFNSARDSWVNVGAGGAIGAQLLGAEDHIRAPGPFSFISSAVSFCCLAASFALYGWTERRVYSRWLVVTATAMLAFAVPVSISRSLLMGFLIVVVFGAAALARDIRRISQLLGPMIAVLVVLGFSLDTTYANAFLTRWDEASLSGAGGFYANVVQRILNEYTSPFYLAADAPLWGHGIGLGTVGGAQLAVGKSAFLLSESELGRIILELGPIIGFAFIAWRVWLATAMVLRSWKKVIESRDLLAWLITGASFMSVLNGQWGPSTQLGFAVFGAGLVLAALNEPAADDEESTLDLANSDECECRPVRRSRRAAMEK